MASGRDDSFFFYLLFTAPPCHESFKTSTIRKPINHKYLCSERAERKTGSQLLCFCHKCHLLLITFKHCVLLLNNRAALFTPNPKLPGFLFRLLTNHRYFRQPVYHPKINSTELHVTFNASRSFFQETISPGEPLRLINYCVLER